MKRARPIFLLLFLFPLLVWAGDPWKDKAYKEWDAKDLARILEDSPWARTTNVAATWKGGGKGRGLASDASADSGAPTTIAGTSDPSFGGVASTNVGPRADSKYDPRLPEVKFIVRWTSSRALREAVVRLGELRGAPVPDGEKLVAAQPLEHELVVIGADLSAFIAMTDAEWARRAWLKPKKTSEKIPALRAQVRKSEEGRRVVAVVFRFPLKTAAGVPIVVADEKSVEFGCDLNGAILKVNFEPQKMRTKEGPEF